LIKNNNNDDKNSNKIKKISYLTAKANKTTVKFRVCVVDKIPCPLFVHMARINPSPIKKVLFSEVCFKLPVPCIGPALK